jgi:hypothetical protein
MIFSLLIMTIYRTIDLVSSTIRNDGMRFMAVFAVVAIDLGVLGWTQLYRSHAQGPQRIVAMLMIVIDLLAVLAAQIGDTALQMNLASYQSTIETVSLFVIPIIVVANIGAFVMYEVLDPENQVRAKLLEGDYADTVAAAELQDMYRDDLIANRKAAYERQAETFVPQEAQEQMDRILRNARGDSDRVLDHVNAANERPDWSGASRTQTIADDLAEKLGYSKEPARSPNGQGTSPKLDDPGAAIKAAERDLRHAKTAYEKQYNPNGVEKPMNIHDMAKASQQALDDEEKRPRVYSGLPLMSVKDAISMSKRGLFDGLGYTSDDIHDIVAKMTEDEKIEFYNPGRTDARRESEAFVDKYERAVKERAPKA